MCDSKAEGGRRCASHTMQEFVAALKSKITGKEKVQEKAENILITSSAPVTYENKSKELASSGVSKVSVANKNLENLKALKNNKSAIKENVDLSSYEREYLSGSDKVEYDQLTTSEDRKKWFDAKKSEDRQAQKEAAEVWRADPASVYDRVGIPSEHKELLEDKNLEVDYVRAIGYTTSSPAIRKKAIQSLVENHGFSEADAEASIPKSPDIIVADNKRAMGREQARFDAAEAKKEQAVADQKSTDDTVDSETPKSTSNKTWYGATKKAKLSKEAKAGIKAEFDAKQKEAAEKAKNKGKKTADSKPNSPKPKSKTKVERTWYGAVKKPKLTQAQKEELQLKQATKNYEAKLKQKAANKAKRRRETKKFFADLFRW